MVLVVWDVPETVAAQLLLMDVVQVSLAQTAKLALEDSLTPAMDVVVAMMAFGGMENAFAIKNIKEWLATSVLIQISMEMNVKKTADACMEFVITGQEVEGFARVEDAKKATLVNSVTSVQSRANP